MLMYAHVCLNAQASVLTYADVCLNAQAIVAEKERLALSAEAAQQQHTLVQDAMRNEVMRLDDVCSRMLTYAHVCLGGAARRSTSPEYTYSFTDFS